MSEYDFVSISAVNGISFSSAFSFTAENEKCFSVGLWYTSQKGLGLGLGLEIKVLVLVLKKMSWLHHCWQKWNGIGQTTVFGLQLVSLAAVKKDKLRWFGHVEHNDDGDWVKCCKAMEVNATVQRRGLTKTWWHCVMDDMKTWGLSSEHRHNTLWE